MATLFFSHFNPILTEAASEDTHQVQNNDINLKAFILQTGGSSAIWQPWHFDFNPILTVADYLDTRPNIAYQESRKGLSR